MLTLTTLVKSIYIFRWEIYTCSDIILKDNPKIKDLCLAHRSKSMIYYSTSPGISLLEKTENKEEEEEKKDKKEKKKKLLQAFL